MLDTREITHSDTTIHNDQLTLKYHVSLFLLILHSIILYHIHSRITYSQLKKSIRLKKLDSKHFFFVMLIEAEMNKRGFFNTIPNKNCACNRKIENDKGNKYRKQ